MYKVYNNTVPEQINDFITKSESIIGQDMAAATLFSSTLRQQGKGKEWFQLLVLKSGMNCLHLLKRIGHLKVLRQS